MRRMRGKIVWSEYCRLSGAQKATLKHYQCFKGVPQDQLEKMLFEISEDGKVLQACSDVFSTSNREHGIDAGRIASPNIKAIDGEKLTRYSKLMDSLY